MHQFLNIIDIIEHNQTNQIFQNIYISSYGRFGLINNIYIFINLLHIKIYIFSVSRILTWLCGYALGFLDITMQCITVE
jgi:hypothetical protein